MASLTMLQRVERMAMALRNFGHLERPPTKRQPNPPLCWCRPIVAGSVYPPHHLGQPACEFARQVLEESGVPPEPTRPIYGHLGAFGKGSPTPKARRRKKRG